MPRMPGNYLYSFESSILDEQGGTEDIHLFVVAVSFLTPYLSIHVNVMDLDAFIEESTSNPLAHATTLIHNLHNLTRRILRQCQTRAQDDLVSF